MKSESGFTLIEVMLAVGLVGVLSSISALSYYQIIPKIQAAESLKLMTAERAKIANSISKGMCANVESGQEGRYGKLTVSGTYAGKQLASCPTGCRLTYTFYNEGVSAKLKGKTIVADYLQNSNLSKVGNLSTLSENLIPKGLESKPIPLNCPVSNDGTTDDWGNNATNGGGLSGSEIGALPPGMGGNNGNDGDGNGNGNGNGNDGDGGSSGNGNGNGNGTTPLNPVEVPKINPTPAEKAKIIKDIEDKLSKGKNIVSIEPQGFDFDVTARPMAPGGSRCEDKMQIKGDEWIVRVGANSFWKSDLKYSVRNQFVMTRVLKDELRLMERQGTLELTSSVRMYIPCSIGVVNPSPRRPSFITGKYNPANGVRINIDNFGVLMGHGGNATPTMLRLNQYFTWALLAPLGGGTFSLNLDEVVQNRELVEMIGREFDLDREEALMALDANGGVAIINQNPSHTIQLNLKDTSYYGPGWDAPENSALSITRRKRLGGHALSDPGYTKNGGAMPYGWGSNNWMRHHTRHEYFSITGAKLGESEDVNFINISRGGEGKLIKHGEGKHTQYFAHGEILYQSLPFVGYDYASNTYSYRHSATNVNQSQFVRQALVSSSQPYSGYDYSGTSALLGSFSSIGNVNVNLKGKYVHRPGTMLLHAEQRDIPLERLERCLIGNMDNYPDNKGEYCFNKAIKIPYYFSSGINPYLSVVPYGFPAGSKHGSVSGRYIEFDKTGGYISAKWDFESPEYKYDYWKLYGDHCGIINTECLSKLAPVVYPQEQP